jgi:hypothetical protein
LTAARLNGDFDPLYACLDPATGGLEDTNVKSGAKIVCTDRAHTVTGVWTFTTAPVLPAASIAESKLILNYATHSPANDPAAGEKAALPGTSGTPGAGNKYVTDADARNTDTRTPTAHASTHASAGSDPITGTRYALTVGASVVDAPADAATYYFGSNADIPAIFGGARRLYIPKAGTITGAYIFGYSTVDGSAENISVYIRLNNTTDTLIETVGASSGARLFDNAALSIAVVAGDYIEIKMVCPTWATNPTYLRLSGSVYIE